LSSGPIRHPIVASVIAALTLVTVIVTVSRQQAVDALDQAQVEALRAEASKLLEGLVDLFEAQEVS